MLILEKVGFNHYNKDKDSIEITKDYEHPIWKLTEWVTSLSTTNSQQYVPIKIWKQLPNFAIEVLERVGYTKYDRDTDSIIFVEK